MTGSSQTVQPISSSNYTITCYEPQSGCSSKKAVTVTVNKCTAVDELTVDKERVFPNPSDGLIYVKMKMPVRFKVYDLMNKLVADGFSAGNGAIDLRQLPDGIYMLKLLVGEKEMTGKLVIAR